MFGSHSREDRSLDLVILSTENRALDLRPVRRFHPQWMYCRVENNGDLPLFVYGPRHPSETTTIPSSLFVLPPWRSTPTRWDCKGILIPAGCMATSGSSVISGPVALKYRDLRRIPIKIIDGRYECPRNNGILEPGQIDFAIPLLSYEELLGLPRRRVTV